MITKLLFDLDGTLTDPKEGICKSAQYALHRLGIEEPDIDRLEPFIGPPLVDSFMEFYNMTRERAVEAVAAYRERFSVRGWSENVVYEGIPDMLKSLRDAGYVLAVASSKPTVFVERILTHFKLREAFSVVVGSELDGRRINKDEVIMEALRRLFAGQEMSEAERRSDEWDAGQIRGGQGAWKEQIRYEEILMIGDRKFDVEGAHALGIRCVGVTYGYAQPGELAEAQADFFADSPKELLKLLLGLREKERMVSGAVRRQGGTNAAAGIEAEPGKGVEERFEIEPGKGVEEGFEIEPGKSVEEGFEIKPKESVGEGLEIEPAKSVEEGLEIEPAKSVEEGLEIESAKSVEAGLEIEPKESVEEGSETEDGVQHE